VHSPGAGVPVASASITELPFALIPTAGVPLLLVLHITAVSGLKRVRGSALRAVAAPNPAAA
jgi:hypothetical protein